MPKRPIVMQTTRPSRGSHVARSEWRPHPLRKGFDIIHAGLRCPYNTLWDLQPTFLDVLQFDFGAPKYTMFALTIAAAICLYPSVARAIDDEDGADFANNLFSDLG